jgi:hypothetical protein
MGAPASEVGYTSATAGREDLEVHKGHVVALKKLLLLVKRHRNVTLWCPAVSYTFSQWEMSHDFSGRTDQVLSNMNTLQNRPFTKSII